ncbi:MAG: hypothetical protein WC607_04365 [Candidatus Micrarchaeia archaeon]
MGLWNRLDGLALLAALAALTLSVVFYLNFPGLVALAPFNMLYLLGGFFTGFAVGWLARKIYPNKKSKAVVA